MAKFGIVVPIGRDGIGSLLEVIADPEELVGKHEIMTSLMRLAASPA